MLAFRTLAGVLLLAGLWTACSGLPQTDAPDPDGGEPAPKNTVVAQYTEGTITLAELDSAFVESAGGRENVADSSLQAYETFLNQYLNFRLKIQAAHDAGLDTLPSITQDVQRYRQELGRPPLLRNAVYEPIVRTLYERRTQAVDVSHILIRPSSNRDTLSAYRTAQAITDSLDRGVPFADLAYRNSDDPSTRKEGTRGYRGRLGYLRAGQIVEPFEERMYALEPGRTSDVFRTKHGYHLLKVHDRRPAPPPLRLSHILRQPQGDSAATRQFLDSLRAEIINDRVTFASAAKTHSHDRQSSSQGGSLGEVTPQALPARLQEAVALLDSVGAVSEVVRSRFGYHLLKLTDRQERESFEEAYDELKKQISDRPRVEQRTSTFARTVRAEKGASVDTSRLLDTADATSVDTLARPLLSLTDSSAAPSPTVATLGDSTYTLGQMAHHLMQTDGGAHMTIGDLVDSFLNEKAIQYAVTRRTQRDPSLAREVEKYRDGALLFRYMQDSVWTAAERDTAGLRATFEQNRDQYQHPERVRTIVLRAPSDSLLSPHKRAYEEGRSLGALLKATATDSLVSTDTVFVTDRSAEVYQPVRSAEDLASIGPRALKNEWLLLIRDTRLPPRSMNFEEARSHVLQDHQQAYEQKLMKQLRNRYDASTYPERLRLPATDGSCTP